MKMPVQDPIDVEVVRKDFPLLSRTVHERPIVYLDSASSSLQPRQVLAAMDHYYETTHANVHRGVYATAEGATALYEGARRKVGRFIGAPELLSALTDITSFSSGRATTYTLLLVFYTAVVIAVVWLCRRFQGFLERSHAAA